MEKKRSKAAMGAAVPELIKAVLVGGAAPTAVKQAKPLDFAEFFGGVGGAGVALAPAFHTKFINEWNECKAAVARLNLGHEVDTRSIAEVRASDLPETLDLIWASFPCQDFSALGQGQGFAEGTRGVMLFELFRILRERREAGLPLPAIVLENVARFVSFGGGADFGLVISALVELGYEATAFIMEGGDFIPVLRRRVFIVAWPRGTVLPPGLVAEKPDLRWTTKPLARSVHRLAPEARAAWRWLTMPPPPPMTVRVEGFLDEDCEHEWYPEDRVAHWLGICHARDIEALRERACEGTAYVLVDAQRSVCPEDGVRRHKMHADGIAHCLTAGNARQRWLRCTAGRFSMRDISERELVRMCGLPEGFRLHGNTRERWTVAGEGLSIPCVAWLGRHVLTPVAEAVRALRERAEARARKAAEKQRPPAPPVRVRRVVQPEAWGQKQSTAVQTLYVAHADGHRLAELSMAEGASKHAFIRTLLGEALTARGHGPLIPLVGGRRDRQEALRPGTHLTPPPPPRAPDPLSVEDDPDAAGAPDPAALLALARQMVEEAFRDRAAANDDGAKKALAFFGGGAAHSSEHSEWWTDPKLVEDLRGAVGVDRFDLDAFSPGAEFSHVPADVHFTKDDDAMEQDWFGNVFANPPYDRNLRKYVGRCRMAVETGEARLVLGVLPARTETGWWANDVVGHADVIFPRGRIAFVDGTGRKSGKSPGHATAIVLWGATPEQVAAVRAVFPGSGFMPRDQGLVQAA